MEFKCNYCDNTYKSYQSRWNHIKKIHKIVDNHFDNHDNHSDNHFDNHYDYQKSEVQEGFSCSKCNKNFSYNQNKWRHEKSCKVSKIVDNSQKIQDDINELKQQNQELKELILKSMKIHPKTLQKINKQLINNGVINNIVNQQNIINIIPLGQENLGELLTEKDKLRILNKRGNGLKEIVDLVHISDKFKQFKNVYITNLQNTIGYKFDSKNNQFIAVNKSELLDDIIDCRMYDIEQFYDNLEERLDPETSKIVKRFIDRMNNNDDELKGIKKEEIKLFLYNSREKIKPIINIEL